MDFMNLQSITSHQPAVRIMTLLLIIVVAILFFSFDARYRFKMAKVREEACGTPSTLRSPVCSVTYISLFRNERGTSLSTS